MAISKIIFAILFFYIHTSKSESLPYITKCTNDPECIKKSTQAAVPVFVKGIPEFKIKSLDPMFIEKIDASSQYLKFIITDVNVAGLKDCTIDKMERSDTKQFMGITCNISFKSKYDVHGRILIVPFEGNGDLIVVLRKLHVDIDVDIDNILDKQQRKHWHIKNYKYTYDLRDKSDIEMTGLFEGNEILGRAARELISSSSNEVILDVCPPIMKAIVEKLVKTVEQFYHAVPVEDLALE